MLEKILGTSTPEICKNDFLLLTARRGIVRNFLDLRTQYPAKPVESFMKLYVLIFGTYYR